MKTGTFRAGGAVLRRNVMERFTNYLHITVLVSTVFFTGVIFASSARSLF
jgi:hypothetical protein